VAPTVIAPTVIAERIGWTRSMTVLKDRARDLYPDYPQSRVVRRWVVSPRDGGEDVDPDGGLAAGCSDMVTRGLGDDVGDRSFDDAEVGS